MTWSVMVVLPEDSGPKTSMTRPRGKPPTPRAASKEMEPVEMTEMGPMASLAPSRMTEPFPNCFSSCESAVSMALLRSSATVRVSSVGSNVKAESTPRAVQKQKKSEDSQSGKLVQNRHPHPPPLIFAQSLDSK